MHSRRFQALAAAALAAAALTAACGGGSGGGESAPAARTPPPDAKRVDAATAGRIAGRVRFEGPPPENPPIKMASDPVCAREHKDGVSFETVVVKDGGLENVFVYVKDGLTGYHFETPAEAVKLDQKGCRYTPHVFGVRAGQPIEIANSDSTLHNVHAVPTKNQGFNFPQQLQGMKTNRTFKSPEIMVPFKCDVHSWMHAYAGVVDHPFFAVTANGGAFALEGLPPGTYTLEAWHEKLGTQTQSVTVGPKESKDAAFTFAAGSGASQ